ncbi:SIP domain-containing protein [Pseudonocardia sp. HH130630-07]|uniref:SIP domain-containing protein n=1 Tax=Pseudonocardia sp. HH130630-07 TaxID=1690815 RepID=UPI0008150AA4|nr:SIP domain-containing protein [Pseudonocardia sp. HH130630-07]ANY10568.1 hypothetical protein AFB00_29610 [Pseudonocardia sp. HH130630-07]
MPNQDRAVSVYPIAVRELTVSRIVDVTPALRRVTLAGKQLAEFTDSEGRAWPAFVSTGFDDDVRLVFPYPGEPEPVLPILKDGGIKLPEGRRPVWRVYTVRRHDPVAGELDVEFVRHGVGIATTWAYRAQPGDRVHVAGPAASLALPGTDARLLVAGDDTAIPAISRLLDTAPADLRAEVFLEIAEDAHRVPLVERPGVRVIWLVRDGAGPGTSSQLVTRLNGIVEAPDWDAASTAAWLAGEQSVVRDLRRVLVAAGVDRRRIDFTGYWKHGEVVTLESDPQITDEEHNAEAFETFNEQAELLPPLAIRAAADLGLGELIAGGTHDPGALAERAGADPRSLVKLLRYLASIGILDRDGRGGYTLTDTGYYLTEDHVLDVLRRDGVGARRERGFFGLEQAVRTGQEVFTAVTGGDYPSLRAEEGFARSLLDNTAHFADYIAAPVADSAALDGIGHLVVHTDAAVSAAAAVVARRPGTAVTIVTPPSDAAWVRSELPRAIPDAGARSRVEVVVQTIAETVAAADAILFGKVLVQYPDAEAAHILRRARECLPLGGRILLLEDVLDDQDIDEHEAEDDLLALVLHGSGLRTAEELAAVITAAELREVATETVGWGGTLRTLEPLAPGVASTA